MSFFGDALGTIGGIFGLANTGSSNTPPAWSPGTGSQSSAFNYGGDLLGQYYGASQAYPVQNYPAQNYGQFQTQTNNLINSPYAQQAQNGANIAASYAPGIAQGDFGGAGQLQGMAGLASPYAQQILQTGFDPQGALYNRTQQQFQDQLQASNNRTGVGASPYGAGVMAQGLQDFNLNWQDRQLGRQNTAAQGYGSLMGSAGNAYNTASQLGNRGLATVAGGAALPYQTQQGQIGNNMAALQALNQAGVQTWALPQQAFNNAGSMIGWNQRQLEAGNKMADSNLSREKYYGEQMGNGIGGLFDIGGDILGSLFGSVGGLFA